MPSLKSSSPPPPNDSNPLTSRELRKLLMRPAHTNRLVTVGELSASITHEVNQPIAAARNNVVAALHFLDRNPSDLHEVREALAAAVKDADRVGAIVGRMRALMQKPLPRLDPVDMNEALQEVIELTRAEALKSGVSVESQLAKACLSLPVIGSNSGKSCLTSFSTPCRRWAQLVTALDRC